MHAVGELTLTVETRLDPRVLILSEGVVMGGGGDL